jgi:ABC-2 type transport system permease protein
VFSYLALLAGFMSTFFVVRHTRADEERGRTELVGATPIGRTKPLLATLVLGLVANVVLAASVALGFIGGGLDARGSWIAGAAAASVGVVFLGIAALAAQVAPTSRSANGISAGLVGVAFLLRAIGDALGTPTANGLSVTSAWPSWLSPIGWGQQVFAFTQQNALPLALAIGLFVIVAITAIALQSTRDLGSSALPERSGRPTGRLRSNVALVWREHLPSLIGWSAGAALLGALAGTLAGRIADSNVAPSLQQILQLFVPGGKGQLIDLLVVAIVGIGGVLAAAAGTQAIIRARSEESDGRSEMVLAAGSSRVRWLLDYLLVAVVSTASVALACGLAAGLSFLSGGDSAPRFWSSLAAGLAQLPAALTFVAATALIFVLLPRLTVQIGWALLVLGFTVGQFGGLLRLPDWVRDASPFTHTPGIPPLDGADWSGPVVLVVISASLMAIAVIAARSRQLTV